MAFYEYVCLAACIFYMCIKLIQKISASCDNKPLIKVISVDGCVGSGKTTLLRHLACGAAKQFHGIVGTYYINIHNNYLLVEEPLHLYQRNGLLKNCLDKSTSSEDIFQVSVMHLLHVHMVNVIELAINSRITTILMERHIETVRRTFVECVIERYPGVEMNLVTGYQISLEDLVGRFSEKLLGRKILHGCIYIDWADHKTLTENILQHGREMETQLLQDGDTYIVNKWLDKKYKHMLEIINVPVYYISEKFGGTGLEQLKSKIDNYIKNI